MRVEIVSEPAAFSALGACWAKLLANAEGPNSFMSPAWHLSWWEAYAPPARLQVITTYIGDTLVGVAPMMLASERRLGIPIKCLRFIGDGTFETDHMNFILRQDVAVAVRDAIFDTLGTLHWDVAVFSNIPENSPTIGAVESWARAQSMPFDKITTACPYRELPDTFDALVASMPSRFRTSIRSTRRKLAAKHRVEFGLHEDPGEFDNALESLFANHESRWRSRGQSGVFENAKRRDFYRTLTRRLHESGALRFFYLKLDDRIVAQEYCFEYDGVVFLLQEGFDYSLSKDNIGNALRSHVFEYLIANHYRGYDFLAGVTRHKMNWCESTINDSSVTVGRRSIMGHLAYRGPKMVEQAKDLVRPLIHAAKARLQRSANPTDAPSEQT